MQFKYLFFLTGPVPGPCLIKVLVKYFEKDPHGIIWIKAVQSKTVLRLKLTLLFQKYSETKDSGICLQDAIARLLHCT